MRPWLPLALTGLVAAPSAAADLVVNVELPKINVAEYHRPYVAIWIERQDQTVAANLAVWYSLKGENDRGTTWLKDLRQWWRRSGRGLTLPIDGVTGATRAPGSHAVTVAATHPSLTTLPPGSYQLVVEAAREVGVHRSWQARPTLAISCRGGCFARQIGLQPPETAGK